MSEVKVSQRGVIGELILNSPATLNALKHDDIKALQAGLDAHQSNPDIKAIVIRSTSEKAFCAGGDMKQMRALALEQKFSEIEQFFVDEYALNLAISRCKKPYIALMQGITMGGGLGVSVHGSARVVTEQSMLAMPESRIGFFPDVGASYFLPKLKHRAGYWLGLTAATVNGQEALAIGLATHCISHEAITQIQAQLNDILASANSASFHECHRLVNEVLNNYCVAPSDANSVQAKLDARQAWFSDDNLAATHQRLETAAAQNNDDAAHLLQLLKTGSPYSADITVQLFRNASGKSLDECLQLELSLCAEAVKHPDCAEGIRSVLVDKDRNPAWQ